MAGSHKFELKFVADVENIIKDFQRVMGQLQQMAQQMRIQIGVDFIGPNGQPMAGGMSGGGGQGTNVVSSPGTTTRSGGSIRDIFGRPIAGQTQIQSDPGHDSSWQRFRQDDPALAMMMAQRAVKEREQHIALMTGGKTASEFLSDRTRSLSGATDPESRATLLALQKFKAELDSTSQVLSRLKKDREEALQMGDIRRASSAQTEIEERTRIKESIVQNAGGGGPGGGAPQWIKTLMEGVTVAAIAKGIQAGANAIIAAPVAAAESRVGPGRLDARILQAGMRMSASDLVMLDPNVMSQAVSAGAFGGFSPIVNPGQMMKGLAGIPGAMAGMDMGMPGRSAEAAAAERKLDAMIAERAVQETVVNEGMRRMGLRRGTASQFGISQEAMAAMSQSFFMPNTEATGFTEEEQLKAANTGFSSNMGMGIGGGARMFGLMRGQRGMLARARATGLDPETLMRQTGGMMQAGGTEESAARETEEIMTRAVARGVTGAGLVKQMDAVVALSQQSAGVGAVSGSGFDRIFNAATQVGGANMGTDAGQSVANMMRQERTTRGGLQGLVNRLTADRTVRQLFPDLTPGARDQVIRALSFHDPSEWGSPMVWNEVMGAVREGIDPAKRNRADKLSTAELAGLRNEINTPSMDVTNLLQTTGEGFRQQLMTTFGGGNSSMGQLMMPGQAPQGIMRNLVSQIIAGGGGSMSTDDILAKLDESGKVNMQDPGTRAQAIAEINSASAGNRGVQAMGDIIKRMEDSAGTLQTFAKGIQDIATHGPGAADALQAVAAQLKNLKKPGVGPASTPR